MIFVTVGTHEQPFDRLVHAIDLLKEQEVIVEDVFIQTGYSRYQPRFCESANFLRFDGVQKKMAGARIIISHAGPASIMMALQAGRIPIVFPRQKKYGEHVDNHQLDFCRRLEEKGMIMAVYDVSRLQPAILEFKKFEEILRQKNGDYFYGIRIPYIARALDRYCLDLMTKGGPRERQVPF